MQLGFIIMSSQLTDIWIASRYMMQQVHVTERRFAASKKEISKVSVNKNS